MPAAQSATFSCLHSVHPASGFTAAMIVALMAGCGQNDLLQSGLVASLSITAPSFDIAVGGSVQLTAVALGPNGTTAEGVTITWRSQNPDIASVNSNGLVTGHQPGVSEIEARAGGASATVDVEVVGGNVPPVATIEVLPMSEQIAVGTTRQFSVIQRDDDGNTLPNRPVTWSSSSTGVASVDASGIVQGVSPGSATITAAINTVAGSAEVEVFSAQAAPPDMFGHGFEDGSFESSNPDNGRRLTNWSGGTPDPDLSQFGGAAEGTTYITASVLPSGQDRGPMLLEYSQADLQGREDVYVAFFYRNSGVITSVAKWVRFHDTGAQNLMGVFLSDVWSLSFEGFGGDQFWNVGQEIFPASELDEWHHMEIFVDLNFGGFPIMRVWRDGQLIMDHVGSQSVPASRPLGIISWLYTVNGGNVNAVKFDLDQIMISSQRIGVPD